MCTCRGSGGQRADWKGGRRVSLVGFELARLCLANIHLSRWTSRAPDTRQRSFLSGLSLVSAVSSSNFDACCPSTVGSASDEPSAFPSAGTHVDHLALACTRSIHVLTKRGSLDCFASDQDDRIARDCQGWRSPCDDSRQRQGGACKGKGGRPGRVR